MSYEKYTNQCANYHASNDKIGTEFTAHCLRRGVKQGPDTLLDWIVGSKQGSMDTLSNPRNRSWAPSLCWSTDAYGRSSSGYWRPRIGATESSKNMPLRSIMIRQTSTVLMDGGGKTHMSRFKRSKNNSGTPSDTFSRRPRAVQSSPVCPHTRPITDASYNADFKKMPDFSP